jgi:hypothetical protein
MFDDSAGWAKPVITMPPRTTLARLLPVGLNTPFVENLSSYFIRLADLHHLSPRVLANYVVLNSLPTSKFDLVKFYKPRFNGVGKTPFKWTEVLGHLTGLETLWQLSLANLKSILPPTGLTFPIKRWCPMCYDDNYRSITPIYDKLLWDIAPATACPEHGIRLMSSCICSQTVGDNISRTKRVPGICMKCGRRKSVQYTPTIIKAEKWEINRAQLIAEFIGDRHKFLHLKKVGFMKFTRGITNNYTNGFAVNVAKLLGFSKGQFSDYLRGNHIPCFSAIIDVAEACKCSVFDVYLGNYEMAKGIFQVNQNNPSAYKRKRHRATRIWTGVDENTIRGYLHHDPISLKQAAAKIGVSDTYLRRNFPVVAKEISNRYFQELRKQAKIRKDERRKLYINAVQELIMHGHNPTRGRVTLALRDWMPLTTVADRRIIAEVIREVKQSFRLPNSEVSPTPPLTTR